MPFAYMHLYTPWKC